MKKYKYFYVDSAHSKKHDEKLFFIYKSEKRYNKNKIQTIGDFTISATEFRICISAVMTHKRFTYEAGVVDINNTDTFIPMIEEYIATVFNNKHREILINPNDNGIILSNVAVIRIADLLNIKCNFFRINGAGDGYKELSRKYVESCAGEIVAYSEDIETLNERFKNKNFDTQNLRQYIMGLGRNHPVLIQVFNEMGSDKFCFLGYSAKVVKVPRKWKWDWKIESTGDVYYYEHIIRLNSTIR